jgi:hypothetical protein
MLFWQSHFLPEIWTLLNNGIGITTVACIFLLNPLNEKSLPDGIGNKISP